MRPNLSGLYVFSIGWMEPQTVTVTRLGENYALNLKDRFDRSRVYESRYIGFDVTEFKTRTPMSLAKIVVYGQWEKAFFVDESGRHYTVSITG